MNTLKFGNGEWYGKKDTILAYNDENSNFKPLPFSFDRNTLATRVNKEGLIETVGSGQPRIDYKDDSKGALKLEPSRSNLILNSQKISLFPIKNGTFTDDFAISPDGTQNATKLTATDTDPFFYQSVSFSSGSYTASIYVKGIGNSIGKDFQIRLGGSGSAQIEIPSEWTRIEYTATMTSGSVNCGIEIPNPSVIGDEVLVWGFQIEQGSYATSIIPTQGSAVTRVADVCNNSNVSVLDLGNSYTLFLDIPYLTNTYNNVFCDIKLSNNVESFSIRNFNTSLRVYNNLDASYPTSLISSSTKKWVIRIDGTSFKLFGAESSLSGSLSTERSIGKVNFKGQQIPIELKDFKIYNTALSDAECQALVN